MYYYTKTSPRVTPHLELIYVSWDNPGFLVLQYFDRLRHTQLYGEVSTILERTRELHFKSIVVHSTVPVVARRRERRKSDHREERRLSIGQGGFPDTLANA